MICVYCYLCTPHWGHTYLHPVKQVIYKFPNDYAFGFDTSDYNGWKRFLSGLRLPSGKLLPRSSVLSREKIVYRVSVFGGKDNSVQYFPGKNADGSKRPLNKYGGLYPIKE